MQAEIVTIGTELLLGEIVDTNSAWIAQRLTTIGMNLFYTATVGDNLQRITDLLRATLARSEVVITTGGLGPTVDDMTREAVAAATDRELVYDPDLYQEIAAFFTSRGRPMTENNRRQAMIPAGARIIHNPVGTAPCFAVEHHGHMIICLPGVPHEMRHLMETQVLPMLGERFGLQGVIKSRILRTCGIGESMVDSRIGDLMVLTNPTVGTAAHPGQTDVRITAKGASAAEADALIAPVEAELRARLGEFVFGTDRDSISDVVNALLADRGLRLALVETSTWGEMAQAMCAGRNGESAFAGGLVAQVGAGPGSGLARALGLSQPAEAPCQALADAAAAAVRAQHGADLGLAVVGLSGAVVGNAPPVYLSLATAEGVIAGPSTPWREGAVGRGWLVHLSLDLVRRHLLGLPLRWA